MKTTYSLEAGCYTLRQIMRESVKGATLDDVSICRLKHLRRKKKIKKEVLGL